VDDDQNALEIIRRMLGGMAYHVTSASDGAGGLDLARGQVPDVIVLDLMMPGMSGFEVLEQLRNDERTAGIPVIVVTAKDLSKEEQTQLEKEAAWLLQKGQFSNEELRRMVKNAILRGTQDGGKSG
jgi:CheY-like chemotaxis protein